MESDEDESKANASKVPFNGLRENIFEKASTCIVAIASQIALVGLVAQASDICSRSNERRDLSGATKKVVLLVGFLRRRHLFGFLFKWRGILRGRGNVRFIGQ